MPGACPGAREGPEARGPGTGELVRGMVVQGTAQIAVTRHGRAALSQFLPLLPAARGYSQPFRLKPRWITQQAATISTITSGYPNVQCFSGIWSKFMP